MAAVPAVSHDKTLRLVGGAAAMPAVRTEAHAMGNGQGVRSARRRIPPESGFALEILGHAIEYLADEYAHEAGHLPPAPASSAGTFPGSDPRVQAIQLLMAANRNVYYACPLRIPLYRRLLDRLLPR
jgi:hypothetical protein